MRERTSRNHITMNITKALINYKDTVYQVSHLLFSCHQESHSEFLLLLQELLIVPGDPRESGDRGWLSRWPACPRRVRAYLHRSGGLGRSRSHRWTHTGPAASAGEAGRTSTRAHWCRWSTVAGRLARQGQEKEKGNLSLAQGHRPGASPCTAQFWRHRESGRQENNSTCLHLRSMYFLPGNA